MCGDISVKIRKYHSSLPASATPPMFGAESSGENFTKIWDRSNGSAYPNVCRSLRLVTIKGYLPEPQKMFLNNR